MLIAEYYPILKAFHILAVIAWMAGLLYMTPLFIYHLNFEVGSKPYLTFCIMERRLLKIIMLPAILLTFIFGILLAFSTHAWSHPWFHFKLLLVFLLAGLHGYFSRIAKGFSRGEVPILSKRMLYFLKELPFLLAIFIVFLAVLKPF